MSGIDPAVINVKEELLEDEEIPPNEDSIEVETEMKIFNIDDIIVKEEPSLNVKIEHSMELERAVKEEMNSSQEIKSEWKPLEDGTLKKEIKNQDLKLELKTEWKPLDTGILKEEMEMSNLKLEIKSEWKPLDIGIFKKEIKNQDLKLEIPYNEQSIKVEPDMKNVNVADAVVKSEPRLVVVITRIKELEQAVKEKILSSLQVEKNHLRIDEEKTSVPHATLKHIHLPMEIDGRVQPRLTMLVCGKCNRCYQEQHAHEDHSCEVLKNDSRHQIFQDSIVCKQKSKSFNYKTSVRRSVLTCADCNMRVANKRLMALHCKIHLVKGVEKTCEHRKNENIYSDKKPYSCLFCSKEFTTSSDRKVHEHIHTGVKPYTCSFCNKTFAQSSKLKIHECTHNGVKPYTCSFCKKTFAQSSKLKIHERIHTGVKPYTCSFCCKEFTTLSNMKKHERIHTVVKPYTCSFCKKTFTHSGQFKIHERIHNGITPKHHSICSKKFPSSSDRKSHESIHTGMP